MPEQPGAMLGSSRQGSGKPPQCSLQVSPMEQKEGPTPSRYSSSVSECHAKLIVKSHGRTI